MAWSYKREEQTFEQVPEGKYRIRIKSAEKAVLDLLIATMKVPLEDDNFQKTIDNNYYTLLFTNKFKN